MNYFIYKMNFATGVHIGEKDLEDSEITIHSDTIFSGLCRQALYIGGEEKLLDFYRRCNFGKILLSDAFPYDEKHYYIAKPQVQVKYDGDGDSKLKKAYKKLKYIPIDFVEDFALGNLNVESINKCLDDLGEKELRTNAAVRGQDETKPYHVGIFHFKKGKGLYVIIGYELEEDRVLIEDLFSCLEMDGIGGRRSTGLGRFELQSGKISSEVRKSLEDNNKKYVSLSTCMCRNEEMKDVVENSAYSLIRRGGFVFSDNYSENFQRKRDIYMFNAGSVFKEKFKGEIFDVSAGGNHPVYRYGKAMWLGVDV